jgi:flagellar basal-body rod protein FlgB
MVAPIENTTTALVSLALDAAGMRHQALAQNIANANTPKYQRMDVYFEHNLTEARAALQQMPRTSVTDLAQFRPSLSFAGSKTGSEAVLLDQEVAKLSENTLYHQTLLKALSKHFALMGMAINEGKR